MKKIFLISLMILAAAAAVPAAFANVLGNASFESPIGNGTDSNWDSTNGATRVDPVAAGALGFDRPPDGGFALRLSTTAQFTFQTYDYIKPGDFVSFSAFAQSAIAAADGGEVRIEFKKRLADNSDELIVGINSTRITTTNAPNGGGNYVQFTASGVAPPGTGRVVFVLREQGSNGNVLFDNLNAEVNPGKLQVCASKRNVNRGDVVTFFAQIANPSASSLAGAALNIDIPAGFDFIPHTLHLNNRGIGFTNSDDGRLVVLVGTLAAAQTVTVSLQVLATTALGLGKVYDFDFQLMNANQLSAVSTIQIVAESDPLFDEGTILGKVFNDVDENGVQDAGEKGVPFVRLATEEGVVITTDEEGRYHIPAVQPGRHLVKIDGHTLPEGTKFVTEETYLVKTTPGILNKANFAVHLPPSAVPEKYAEDLSVTVTQGLDAARPQLDVSMDPDPVRIGLQRLGRDVVFKFKMNYPDLVKTWYLEIRDETGREVWTGFGVSAPPAEVVWSGQTESGFAIKPGIYSYQFKVKDAGEREDWTPLHFFRVISEADSLEEAHKKVEIPPIGDFNIFKDGKQSIPLVAKPTLQVRGKIRPGYQVAVNSRPVPVDPQTGIFQTEIYTKPGEHDIVVTAASPSGEVITHRQKIKVKDSAFFMVALGEEELGNHFVHGNTLATGKENDFKEKFYTDGRLSYYLRGKLKGKFLVKSHLDTSGADNRNALFTNLDPDKYYPIYGDTSTRDYDANSSLDKVYTVIEMDRSFMKWGSYKTEFTDTDLATYNRTLSGLKLSYETLGSTSYGDPKRGFKLFSAKSQHRADHNEFAATGGSLYYLRNRRVIEGSEKIRVEIRDKIQDIAIDSYELKEGKDYEIDYDDGRLMLSRPLSSVAATDTLVSRDIMDGDQVFLIVDYEHEADRNLFDVDNRGFRGYTHIGDHLKIGATAVEEQRENADYDLRGVDGTFKLGRNTKISAEYAEAKNQQTQQGLSFNGGLSFREEQPLHGRRPREKAYRIKGESKPMKNLETSAFIQDVEPGFSTAAIRDQEGIKKYGAQAKYKITDTFYVRYRYDSNEVVAQLRPLHERNVSAPFEKVRSHTAQTIYDGPKWLAEAEYLRQTFDLPGLNLEPSLLSEIPFNNAVAGKLGYHLNERLLPYLKTQLSVEKKPDHQWGGGLRYDVTREITAYIEQMFGSIGDATYFGFEKFHGGGARSYVSIRTQERGVGGKTLSTTVGSSFQLAGKSRVYSEREYSSYQSEDGFADILGYEGSAGDHWDYGAKFERRHLDNSKTRRLDIQADQSLIRTNTFNVISGALGYADRKKLRARTSWEFRRDQDSPRLFQWVTRDSAEYHLTQDFSMLGKIDFGKSRLLHPNDTAALFAEFNIGFAYRPVDNDRLNVLTRYTYDKDIANDIQFATGLFQGIPADETAHVVAIDLAYDLFRHLGMVDKLAYKKGIFDTAVSSDAVINTFLLAHRFNFHVTRKWDIALEYRWLLQSGAADSTRHGPQVEIDREFYDYVRLGLGYNFTDFDDDLRKPNSFRSHGPFVRLTGKF